MRCALSIGNWGKCPTHLKFPFTKSLLPAKRQATLEPIIFVKRLSVSGSFGATIFFTSWGGFFRAGTSVRFLGFTREDGLVLFIICFGFGLAGVCRAGGLGTISCLTLVLLSSPLPSPSATDSFVLMTAVDPPSRSVSSSSSSFSSDSLALW